MKIFRNHKRRILPAILMLTILFIIGCQCEGQIGNSTAKAGKEVTSGLQVDNK